MSHNPMTKARHTQMIRDESKRLGFSYCGLAKAEFLEEEAPELEKWLKEGKHGKMEYMERNFDKRLDPTKLVPGAKTVVSLMFNYFPDDEEQNEASSYKVSKYAYGRDYHKVVKKKLKQLLDFIHEHIGDVEGRGFVDSAPMMDKAWAKKAGVGWLGKHTNILNKQQGSYFFLAELVIDLELEYDAPMKDFCGSCTRCIDACPTNAIAEPYKVDANKCISYLTIELKEEMPDQYKDQLNGWIFGCDICQDVCPWNKFSKKHQEPDFEPREPIKSFEDEDWEEITEEIFEKHFKGTALKRAKFEGLKNNIKAVKAGRG